MTKKESSRTPTANIPPFGLRMQAELKEAIEKSAQASGRSMNAEIVARLEQSLQGPQAEQDLLAFEAKLDRYLEEFTYKKEQRDRLDQAVISMLGLAILSTDRSYTNNMINMAIKLLGGEEVKPNVQK